MKIRREKLLGLVTGELSRIQATVEQRNRKARELEQSARTEYVAKTSEAWRETALAILRVVEAGEPVTSAVARSEIKSSGFGTVQFFQSPRASYVAASDLREYRELESLLRLLQASEDEVISTYQLEKAGYRLATMMRHTAVNPPAKDR